MLGREERVALMEKRYEEKQDLWTGEPLRRSQESVEAQIIDLRQRGLTYNQIEVQLRVSQATVVKALRAAGMFNPLEREELHRLDQQIVDLRKGGNEYKAIAERLHVSFPRIWRALARFGMVDRQRTSAVVARCDSRH